MAQLDTPVRSYDSSSIDELMIEGEMNVCDECADTLSRGKHVIFSGYDEKRSLSCIHLAREPRQPQIDGELLASIT
ncbi:MAG: hypothetical protein EPN91_12805 [Salinibacterium sp.]|nr:MAG: hypothetical protein EPN91_12805 [Salinibacterium sp.]